MNSFVLSAPGLGVTADSTDVTAQGTGIDFSGVIVDFPDPAGGTKRVLEGIDLRIPSGEFVVLIGKSGCGKTTLLNVAAALIEPTGGRVTIAGIAPHAARPRMGFMLARDALLPWRSAIKNVEYGLELRHVPKAERRRIAERWLAAVHLEDAGRLWPWQLSQGMRQRVALARTWALDPDILLMDEPFAALDANTRLAVQQEFLTLWQQGRESKTVIFVTHDLSEGIALADRVVVLGDGKIVDDVEVGIERPRDLKVIESNPRYQELYQRLRAGI